jgi:nucleoside-diphosphate-sugar epimerase
VTVLVIGGSGFIGARLVERLVARGDRVRVFDRAPSVVAGVESAIGDVTQASGLEEAAEGVSSIVNLAAEHRDDVRPLSRYEQVNVGGAEVCVAVAERRGIDRIVFTSSVAVYAPSVTPVDESVTPDPRSPYGQSKLAAEAVYARWQAAAPERRALFTLRPCVVFGAGNRGNVYNLIKQIADGRFLMIGDGGNEKSLAYVDNVAAALEFGLSKGAGSHLFNYSDSPDFNMRELVTVIRQGLGRPAGTGPRLPYGLGLGLGYVCDLATAVTRINLPVSSERVRKFCANTGINSERIRTDGLRPQVELRSALLETIAREFPS